MFELENREPNGLIVRFTDKGIQALKKRKARYEVIEDGTGLAVRVSIKGAKTFSYLYRFGVEPICRRSPKTTAGALETELSLCEGKPRGGGITIRQYA